MDLIEEKNELHDRLLKLKKFIISPQFKELDAMDRHLLRGQEKAMETYLELLIARIK